MCNEYSFKLSLDRLALAFDGLDLPLHWAGGAPNLEPRDTIRPTDEAPVVVGSPEGAELKQLRWGLVQPGRPPVINFRSDGRRFPSGRCLVPADGFYEFTGAKYPKTRWLFTPADGSHLFAIAGLVRDDRFTMLTTPPGPDVAPFHDRQVAILPQTQWADWLGPAGGQFRFAPLPAGSLAVREMSRAPQAPRTGELPLG